MKISALAIALLLVSPSIALASTADLSIDQSSISFSGDLIAGSTIRVYAQVNNVGDVDVDGYVTFYQGSAVIGESLIISVRADGAPEEVYVDFVVPDAAFNIRAEIRGTDPEDENSANDGALTKLYTPVPDEDGDGVEDASDNCVDVSNSNQKDTDGDGFGNVCDDDDDGDGVTDDVETENGSDPLVTDTDGDGVSDAKDAYPTDKTRSKVIAPVVPAPKPVTTTPSVTPAPTVAIPVATAEPVVAEPADPEAVPEEIVAPTVATTTADAIAGSQQAVFQNVRTDWNAYSFKAVVPDAEGYQYQWDFGDGVTSSRSEVRHTYTSSGDFPVTFTITAPDGTSSTETTVVHVPFWTLQNRVVDVLIGFLGFLLLIGIGMIARLSRLSKVVAKAVAHVNTVVEEDEELDAPKSKRLHVRNLDE